MNPTDRVQILDEAVDISHSANTMVKKYVSNYLPPTMAKL